MRIQHNIMAMNAYRNYNTNNKALSGNLEKLSSGYKINRAGDDAAGLAISEKMRAQITGLNAAQKNVKDGISLVKTAEGAMQEIQDMLNRMDYLATQSANGTYQDEVDREALQKEVNQLKDEIDRIADSANFNGIKLLDGSKDGTGASLKAAQSAAKAAADKVTEARNALQDANDMKVAGKTEYIGDVANKGLLLSQTSTSAGSVGTHTILQTEASDVGEVGFHINLDGVKYVMGSNGTSASNAISLTIGSATLSLNEVEIENLDSSKAVKGTEISGADLAKMFAKKYGSAAGTAIDASGSGDDLYKVTADGADLKFAAQDNLTTRPNRHYDVKLTTTNNTANVKTSAVQSTYTSTAVSFGTGATSVAKGATVKMTVNYQRVKDDNSLETATKEISVTTATTVNSVGDLAKLFADKINEELGDVFFAESDNAGKITLTSQTGGAVEADGKGTVGAAKATGITAGTGLGSFATGATSTAGENAYTAGLGNSYVNKGTEEIVQAGDDGKAILASTTLNLTGKLTDGTLIELGGEKYRIALGANSAYKGDLSEYEGAKVVYLKDESATEAQIASKLAEVAKDNRTFTVSHIGTDGRIGLKQLESVAGTKKMDTLDKIAGYIKVSTIGTAGDQAIKDKAIAEAQANYDAAVAKQTAADAKVTELAKNPGKALQLQIGDTSDAFNQLQVNIGSMKTDALGIADLDIGTAEKAAAAIATVKDAINNVSSVRGDLGAYQNRLDHTANNLSVMAENIQDAESTIRDTDVAEEMMSYVKNNILVQSAQAMLAQANQVPQGVLQLLG